MADCGGIVVALDAAGGRDEIVGVAGACLVPVVNRPLIDRAIERLIRAGVDSVAVAYDEVIAAGVRKAVAAIDRWEIPLWHVELPEGSGEVAAVIAASQAGGWSRVIVHSGDVLLEQDLGPLVSRIEAERLAAIAVVDVNAPVAVRSGAGGDDGGVRDGPAATAAVLLLDSTAYAQLAEAEKEWREDARLERVVDAVAASGRRVERIAAPLWRYRPGPDALLEAHRSVLDRIEADVPRGTLDGATVHGRVIIDPSAHVRRSVIRGPVVIGAHARIEDAYIGPYTTIAERCIVRATEIEHSVLLSDAHVSDVGFRLESSVIGPAARVSRTFALPKALHLAMGPRARVTVS